MSKANDFRLYAEEAIRCSPIRNQTSERGADQSCAHMDPSCVYRKLAKEPAPVRPPYLAA
jgi:hypothetical protein